MTTKTFFHLSSFFLVSLFFYSCSGSPEIENYQVKGKLTNSSGEYVSFVDANNASAIKVLDSVKLDENGEFVFTKKVPCRGFYSIQISPSNYATIITDSTEKITIEADAKQLEESYKVTGSAETESFLKFNDFTRKNFKQMEKIRANQDSIRRVFEAYMNTTRDSLKLDSLSKSLEPTFNKFSEEYGRLAGETEQFSKKFIDDNTSSFASIAAVQMLNPDRDITYYIKVADALSAKYPAIQNLKSFRDYVDKIKKLAFGVPAPEIELNNPDGKPIALSSMKGKVVILDFWASWCKPCRAENPFLVDLYKKYKDQGLDIYSVSLDFDKTAWLTAISTDKLSWKNHVSDLKQWESPVVPLYGFTGIPFSCVLDREGKIAGKNLRGPALEMKVKELLEEKKL